MPGSKSDYLENKILDHVIGGVGFIAPTFLYVALYTVAPTDSGGGTEVTGGSYARKLVVNNLAQWPAAVGGAKSNANAITFITATANWGTIVAFALFDAGSGGNMLYWGDLVVSKVINSGDTAKFNAGDIDVTED